jgi:hypothetical protein
MIRLGEWLRHPTESSWANHVGVIVEPGIDRLPRIVAAGARGVAYAYLKDIDAEYEVVSARSFMGNMGGVIDPQRVVEQAHELVGAKYGWLTITSIVLNILTPKWLRVPIVRRGSTYICSAAAAWCLHAGGGLIMDALGDVYQIMPSELRALAA